MSRPSVGVVGLGLMGGSIASHLVGERFNVHGFDPDTAASEAAADHGVTIEPDAATVAESTDIVLTSLPSSDAVRDAYLGDDGLRHGAEEGTVAIEISTIDPDTTFEVADDLTACGVTLIDSPVSGGPEDAGTGTLTTLVGRDADIVDSPPVADVLDAISEESFHVGEAGAGHTAKLLNNVMSMRNLRLAIEAIFLGINRGLDGEQL